MKSSLLLWLISCPALSFAQQNQPADFATMTAARLSRDGSIVRGMGHVQVKIAGVLLEADEGVLDRGRQTLELKGRALVNLPPGPPFWTIRYGPGRVIVATEPLAVAADQMSFKAGMLRARGHIHTRKDLTVFQADEAEFYLNAAEAELQGNILVDGAIPGAAPFRSRDPRTHFPPDIVK